MYEFTVTWHTVIGPASTYYSGTKTFRANYNNRMEVTSRAKREIARDMGMSPSSIVITNIESPDTDLTEYGDEE